MASKLAKDTITQIESVMKREGVSKSELSRRIGKSRGHMTHLLTYRRNMTLETLEAIGKALDTEFIIEERRYDG